MESQWELSRHFRVICSDKSTALVYENHKTQDQGYTMNLNINNCSCKDFQDIQIPCRHAIAAIWELKYAVNDFIHDAYFITSYRATYEASFKPINMEELSDNSDCEPCNIQSRRGRIPKKRKHRNRSQPSKQANTCSICKKSGHTKRSPLCSRYQSESFFYTQPNIGIKVRESAIKRTAKSTIEIAAEPAIEPAVQPAIEPAAEPATERAGLSSSKKRKQDWRIPTKKNEEYERECNRFNAAFFEKFDRLPQIVDEDPNMKQFGGFHPGFRRLRKRTCN